LFWPHSRVPLNGRMRL